MKNGDFYQIIFVKKHNNLILIPTNYNAKNSSSCITSTYVVDDPRMHSILKYCYPTLANRTLGIIIFVVNAFELTQY